MYKQKNNQVVAVLCDKFVESGIPNTGKMDELKSFDLAAYMSNAIRNIMKKAYKNVLQNPREARFALRMQWLFEKSEKRRSKILETGGIVVPPFLICSISTTCNLHCKGCYARSNGIANDKADSSKPTLTPAQWHQFLAEAAGMGVNFSLLAGGEPFMRRDILEKVAEIGDMIFPVFTNGTLLGANSIAFLREHLNIVPVISIEGSAAGTDLRRGEGVFRRAVTAMEALSAEKLFFGTSITVTTENYRHVTSSEFISKLDGLGCKMIIYVEYVPTESGTEHLALGEEDVLEMERLVEQRRDEFDGIIFLSFPGDEKESGGCMASGRGFFHVGPDGSAEPCPFSPYSDSNVVDLGLRGALQSPLFRKIRAANALNWKHTGGCTLFEHRGEIEKMMGTN